VAAVAELGPFGVKLPRTRIGKVLLVGSSFIVAALSWSFGLDRYWRLHPHAAFRSITGRALPPGVRAKAYGREMNDNLFHTTHYWLVAGSPSALLQVTNGTGFVVSEDARYMMPDLHRTFGSGIEATQVVVGYEWELGRDRWYCILAGETTAFYAH
jgi:hypothetical protein